MASWGERGQGKMHLTILYAELRSQLRVSRSICLNYLFVTYNATQCTRLTNISFSRQMIDMID